MEIAYKKTVSNFYLRILIPSTSSISNWVRIIDCPHFQALMVEFLLIIIEAHHPNGVGENSSESYAVDWDNWKITLRQLSYVLNKEISILRKYDEKSPLLSRSIIKLVVEIYNQVGHSLVRVTVGNLFLIYSSMIFIPLKIFQFDEHPLDISCNFTGNDTTFDANPSKRRRITNGFTDLIDRLDECSRPIDMCPWLADYGQINWRVVMFAVFFK